MCVFGGGNGDKGSKDVETAVIQLCGSVSISGDIPRANLLIITVTQMLRSQRTAHKHIFTPPVRLLISLLLTCTHRHVLNINICTHTLRSINTKSPVCCSLLLSTFKSLSFPPHLSCFLRMMVMLCSFHRKVKDHLVLFTLLMFLLIKSWQGISAGEVPQKQ